MGAGLFVKGENGLRSEKERPREEEGRRELKIRTEEKVRRKEQRQLDR